MNLEGVVLTTFAHSEVGTGHSINEDAFLISDLSSPAAVNAIASQSSLSVRDRGVLVAVSDGMGGSEGGEAASLLTLQALNEGMSLVFATAPDLALRVSIENANQRVHETALATRRTGMGATLTAILFHGVDAYVAEVGDSRAYLLRERRFTQLTHDQSYVQQLLDVGGLAAQQAETSPFKNVILQALGPTKSVNVVIRRIAIRKWDRYLVCSDGLSGRATDDEIRNVLVGSETLRSACTRLAELARCKGCENDITIVLAEVGGNGAPVITEPERLALETSTRFEPS